MHRIAGIYGNSNRDDYLQVLKMDHTPEGLIIKWFGGSTTLIPLADKRPKVTLPNTPGAFPRHVLKSRGGGGVLNSRVAAGFISEAVGGQNEIRYLDANRYDGSIASELPPPARTLALRESPTNYVVGDGDDKKIFRAPFDPAAPLGASHFADIKWFCKAQTVLVNSPKDEEPVSAILDERRRTGSEVIFVLTPSLPVGFLKSTVLPAADVLIGAWDELQFLTGESPVSMEGAALAATRLREMAPNAEIHVTLGSLGVLSMAAGSDEMAHVVLDSRASVTPEVQQIVRERPARLNGAGDAFAGGLLVRRAFGWSLVSGSGAFLPHVHGALAACGSALRWIGVRSGLTADAFVVRALPVAVGA